MRQLDYLAQTEIAHRQHERAAKLERAQRVREALAGERGSVSFYRPLLINFGRRLEKFGADLQARYSVNLELSHSGTLARETPC